MTEEENKRIIDTLIKFNKQKEMVAKYIADEEIVDMDKFNVSYPWVIYATKVFKLFEYDDEIDYMYDESENVLKLYVSNAKKYDALCELFPAEKKFGNVTMKITIIPSNTKVTNDKAELIETVLKDNPHFVRLIKVDPTHSGSASFNYLMFNPNVVQFFSDNVGDPNGNTTMLVQDLAKDVFGAEAGVYFCTEEDDPEDI